MTMSQFNRLLWNNVPWAESVEIERKVDSATEFTKIGEVTDKTIFEFKDENIELGKKYTYRLKFVNTNFHMYSNEVVKEFPDSLAIQHNAIKRFNPIHWRIDGNPESSFCVTSENDTSMRVTFTARTNKCLAGLIWDTIDGKDHAFLAYQPNQDYTNTTLKFRLSITGDIPDIFDEQLGLTMTIRHVNSTEVHYVAIRNYATRVGDTGKVYDVELDFNTIKAGFYADIEFNKTDISQVFFSVVSNSYNGTNNSEGTGGSSEWMPLAVNETGTVLFTNVSVTGSNSTLVQYGLPTSINSLGMCTSYDDHYDLNPRRLVQNLVALGYSGFMNHYCGMSHYPECVWDADAGKFQIIDSLVHPDKNVVNLPTRMWHDAFARELKNNGFTPIFSVSFEMYSVAGREYWAQRDYNDNLGKTGYTPPSYFFSITHPNAKAYLFKAFEEMADILWNNDLPIKIQIGESWWWVNPTDNMPCVYDFATRTKFNQDTGLYAPNLGDIYEAMTHTDPTSVAFKNWLQDELGNFCIEIKHNLNVKYPTAQVAPLIFLPSIFTTDPSLATQINFPVDQYKSPNFDFFMLEAYDWLIQRNPTLGRTVTSVAEVALQLGYGRSKTYYLVGFVPDPSLAPVYHFKPDSNYAEELWKRIFGDFKNQQVNQIEKILVWAYPQVMAHALTFFDNPNFGYYLGEKYYEPVTDDRPYPDHIFDN